MNTFDVRRTAAVENLHVLDRMQMAACLICSSL
jgi:hypothetical protein